MLRENPHVIQIYDAGIYHTEDDQNDHVAGHAILMEKADQTLLDFSQTYGGGVLKVDQFLAIARETLQGLEALHGAGLLHGDIKSNNAGESASRCARVLGLPG